MSRSAKSYLPPEDEPELIPAQHGKSPLTQDDINLKVQEVQEQLLELHRRQVDIERQKRELEELSRKQREFDDGRHDLQEKLTRGAVILESQELGCRKELEQVTQIRAAFSDHLSIVERMNPAEWTSETLPNELTRALARLDQARDVYEQASVRLTSLRSSDGGESFPSDAGSYLEGKSFPQMVWEGFAYSFPLLFLGLLALGIYLLRH